MRKSYAERKSNGQENQRYLGKIQGANIVPNRIDCRPLLSSHNALKHLGNVSFSLTHHNPACLHLDSHNSSFA
jgi:hypothetical protein